MRVLVVTNMYPPHHLGGYELACRDVVRRWVAWGHDVRVLTTDHEVSPIVEGVDADTYRVRRTLRWYWKDHRILEPSFVDRLRIERSNQAAVKTALEEAKPDVVSVWHMGAMSLGLLTTIAAKRVPMVFVVLDDWLVYGPIVDAWTSAFTGRPMATKVVEGLFRVPAQVRIDNVETAFCFVSDVVRHSAETVGGWPLSCVAVVPLGIETRDFAFGESSRAAWNGRLLCVGRVEERKGTHVAVQAAAQIPDAHLDIIGPADPAYASRLVKLAQELGVSDRVRFDVVPRAKLAERYRRADALLFPVTWEEPFGLVPLEAMACGVPVVATRTGGAAGFLFHERNCLAVPTHDAAALGAAIRRLAADPELRSRLARNGLATAQQVSVDVFARELGDWHLAAAARFADGAPPEPAPLRDRIEAALAD